MRTTLKDIAREAGVAVTTASVVLRDDFSITIRAETRQRIKAIAERLHYRRNLQASTLRLGRSNWVGLLVSSLDVPVSLLKLQQLDRFIHDHAYRGLMRNSSGEAELEAQFIHEYADSLVAGVVLVQGGTADTVANLAPLLGRGVPVISLEPLADPRVDCVTVDREHGAWLAVRHLLELGHRRIGFLHGAVDSPLIRQRLAGYERALREAKLEPDPALLRETGMSYAGGFDATREFLQHDNGATALFGNNDEVAIGAMRAILDAGLRIPQDMSIVGFDNVPAAPFAPVPLTTVAQPVEQIAREAAERLFRRIAHTGAPLPSLFRNLKPSLIVRASTARARP